MKLSVRISNWIKGQVRESSTGGIVVGMSGGIDSAVVAVLAGQACGGNVLGLIMPCYSSNVDEKDALLIANKYNINTQRVELAGIYKDYLGVLQESNRVVMANLKPRLRMTVLYYYANMMNYLVAGTGNKCEIMLGYYTKYGDGGADILPVGGLLKSEVRELAAELDIPERIINRIPSAGLWKGQTDEGEMGLTYDEIERIIISIEKGRKPGIAKKKYEKAMRMIKSSKHKRETAAIFREKKR